MQQVIHLGAISPQAKSLIINNLQKMGWERIIDDHSLNSIKSIVSISHDKIIINFHQVGWTLHTNQLCDLKRLSLHPSISVY